MRCPTCGFDLTTCKGCGHSQAKHDHFCLGTYRCSVWGCECREYLAHRDPAERRKALGQ